MLSCWLHDTTIDTAERARRGVALAIYSLRKYLRYLGKRTGAEHAKTAQRITAERKNLTAYAMAQGWEVDERPTFDEFMSEVMPDDQWAAEIGDSLWHTSSAVTHGDLWALAAAYGPATLDEQTGRTVASPEATTQGLVQAIAFGYTAHFESLNRRLRYYGVAGHPDLIEAHEAFKRELVPYLEAIEAQRNLDLVADQLARFELCRLHPTYVRNSRQMAQPVSTQRGWQRGRRLSPVRAHRSSDLGVLSSRSRS